MAISRGDFTAPAELSACRVMTTADLGGLYQPSFPGSGIDATITNNSTLGVLTVDGVALHLNDSLVVANQTNAGENGIYEVINAGSATSVWQIIRRGDFQSLQQIFAGQFTSIGAGTTHDGNMVVLIEPLPLIFGTDPILFETSNGTLGLGTASTKAATDNSLPDVASTSGVFVVNDLLAAADTSGTVKDSGVSPSDATKAKVASVNGAVVVGHIATYSDVLGTITDGGPVPSGGGSAPPPELRSDATALTAANITANIALGQNRYLLSSATGVPITLPPSTGSGVVLEFFSGMVPTSNGYVWDCDSTGTLDRFDSDLTRHAGADAAMLNIDGTTAGNHNRMTLLNGISGTGGERGDVVRLTDYLADHWLVEGSITAPAGAIAVFSSF